MAKADVISHLSTSQLIPVAYRPFDNRWTYFTGTSRGFLCRPRTEVMRHMAWKPNLALVVGRQGQVVGNMPWNVGFVVTAVNDFNLFYRGGGAVFPAYLDGEGPLDQTVRLNFDPKLYAKIREAAGLTGTQVAPDGTDAFRRATGDARPDEVKVFDYIYGVLHCPAYRETYAEFLKIDFPRIPFPPSPEVFGAVSEKGEQLRRLHLMEDAAIGETPYPFQGEGDSVVEKPGYGGGRVTINPNQYFENVPAVVWEFHIGGYQPAQKWLKDRKGRALSWDDIRHYQKIIKILVETDRIMKEIELPLD